MMGLNVPWPWKPGTCPLRELHKNHADYCSVCGWTHIDGERK